MLHALLRLSAAALVAAFITCGAAEALPLTAAANPPPEIQTASPNVQLTAWGHRYWRGGPGWRRGYWHGGWRGGMGWRGVGWRGAYWGAGWRRPYWGVGWRRAYWGGPGWRGGHWGRPGWRRAHWRGHGWR